MEVSCGRCGHPGVHPTLLPPRGGGGDQCRGCTECEREVAEAVEKRGLAIGHDPELSELEEGLKRLREEISTMHEPEMIRAAERTAEAEEATIDMMRRETRQG